MEQNTFDKQRELTKRLNRYREEYYNQNAPSVSDAVYDRLFDELNGTADWRLHGKFPNSDSRLSCGK